MLEAFSISKGVLLHVPSVVQEPWLMLEVCADVTEGIQVRMTESASCVLLENTRLKLDTTNVQNALETLGAFR